MKYVIVLVTALTTLTASAQIGVDAIAKQRARDVANQNNNRGTQMPGATTTRPATAPGASTTSMTPAQQAFAGFQTQLLGVTTNVTVDQKNNLARDMGTVAQGPKPSQGTLTKLSDHLTTALAESTKLTSQRKTRLAQEIGVLLNSLNTPQAQKDAMIKDVQDTLESGGASTDNASAVAADLKTVTEEIKPSAK